MSCRVKERDQYGRLVAACAIPAAAPGGKEDDAGDYMVRRGQAVAYKKITPEYLPAESVAKKQKVGIWQGSFEQPAKWRYDRRQAEDGSPSSGGPSDGPPSFTGAGAAAGAASKSKTSAAKTSSKDAPQQPGCQIKGNIGVNGEKIYHLPGSPVYASTKIDTAAGEKYFCSEEEAVKAGFRPSRLPMAPPTFTSSAGARHRR